MKEFQITEQENGFIVHYHKHLGLNTRVYEFDPMMDRDMAKKQTMCRMLNDIIGYFGANLTLDDVRLVAHLIGNESPEEQKED